MKVFIFNREKYIKERLDFHKEYSEKVSKLTDEEKERMIKRTTWINLKTYFKWASEPSEKFEKELKDVRWAKELDGIVIDNWINHFGNHLEYYNRYIDEKWCNIVEDEDYVLDYRKVTNIYVLYELLKEKSNNKEMFKTKELIDTLNKFGEVERDEGMGDLALYFKDGDSRDDIWIEKVDEDNCYITAYGCWDGRAGAMLFDNRDEYNKNIGWLKLTDEMIEDIENGNFKIKFEIKDPYMFEVGKEKDNK